MNRSGTKLVTAVPIEASRPHPEAATIPLEADHRPALESHLPPPVPPVEPPAPPIVSRQRSLAFRTWDLLIGTLNWVFGFCCLLISLAVLASIPLLQFLSLGYLLEASGRISRSGRLRDGFIGIDNAARIGSLVTGTWLMLLPVRFVGDLWYTAQLIDPDSKQAAAWFCGLTAMIVVMMCHIVMAWFCGGKMRHFFWPLLTPFMFGMWIFQRSVSRSARGRTLRPLLVRWAPRLYQDLTNVPPLNAWFPPSMIWAAFQTGNVYARCRDAVWSFVKDLEAPGYFWLGLRGFVGALMWLIVPIVLLICTTKLTLGQEEPHALGVLLGLLGSVMMLFVTLYLPFLQTHFAAERRFAAMFEFDEVREYFRRAPLAFWFSLVVTLLFAVPLYLLKVAMIPREVVWLPSLVFVAFILPARFATGWALGRARKREFPRHFLFRWLARLSVIPVVLLYVMIVFFTQYISWYGSWSLFEQHAFLTPVPFLGL